MGEAVGSTAEAGRLAEERAGAAWWSRWGPYVALRQWGTVREDYSADGDAWRYFPYDHARSRAYRWSEDGLAALCDRWQHACLGVALWNGRDDHLKERLFGLANHEGNHGEDVKEHWWPLDATPTGSWLRWLYRYPQAAFPYALLREENARRSRDDEEFELLDTGVLDDGRFFDVEVSYAKAAPDDICMRIACTNHGPERAALHVLPTVWFRNTWSWGRDARHPRLAAADERTVALTHSTLGPHWLTAEGSHTWLFCENETNERRLYGLDRGTRYPKDGIGDHVVHGTATVNPAGVGTKAAAWHVLDLAPGETRVVRLRLADRPLAAVGEDFDEVIAVRAAEADAFYGELAPDGDAHARLVHRRALAGLLWTKQYYHFHVGEWLDGDPASPPPPAGRGAIRNGDWPHVGNTDIISMPDAWEYPWYAAWDLAFHVLPLAQVDAEFAKEQLILLCREWYMHPSGQLPAYEWAFDDVNPPVHAWAALRVFQIDAAATGRKDYDFLERVFHKLLLNFTWWVNRKDRDGKNVFGGGFLGLDNIGLFDRSKALPGGGHLEQADGTSWMAMYCLNLLAIALELADHDRTYEDVATKFFEHFLAIASALNTLHLWNDEDGFFYDVLHIEGREPIPLKVRSAVGLIPLFAVSTIEPAVLAHLPDFARRMEWFLSHRPSLCANVFALDATGKDRRRLLSVLHPDQLRRVLTRLLDPAEFLAPFGVRSMSRHHDAHPVTLRIDGECHQVAYEPAESRTWLFGGNSNWRGPIWWPINFLIIEALERYHDYFGADFTVELPTGSGRRCTLDEVAVELSRRLCALFLPDADGRRPLNGTRRLLDDDRRWRDHIVFPEYFHGDTGAGLGATHQTGWTALVATLLAQRPGLCRTPLPLGAPSRTTSGRLTPLLISDDGGSARATRAHLRRSAAADASSGKEGP